MAIRGTKKKGAIWAIVISLLIMTLAGCKARERNFIIGVIGSNPFDTNPIWLGFHEEMAEFGYIEGQNLEYIIKFVPKNDAQVIDAAIKEILAENIDMLLTLGGNLVDQRTMDAVQGTDLPVLIGFFAGAAATEGIESTGYRGGNITGVQRLNALPKALEHFKEIVPELKIIYIPYNPDDKDSTDLLLELNRAASQLGLELIFDKIYSVQEAVAAINNLSGDVDAVFMIPSPTLNVRSSELSRAAIERRLPIGSCLLQSDTDVLITFSVNFFGNGKLLANMARKILQGTKPSDLPIEIAEVTLIINLKTAEKIGLEISEIALVQATTIIR